MMQRKDGSASLKKKIVEAVISKQKSVLVVFCLYVNY